MDNETRRFKRPGTKHHLVGHNDVTGNKNAAGILRLLCSNQSCFIIMLIQVKTNTGDVNGF